MIMLTRSWAARDCASHAVPTNTRPNTPPHSAASDEPPGLLLALASPPPLVSAPASLTAVSAMARPAMALACASQSCGDQAADERLRTRTTRCSSPSLSICESPSVVVCSSELSFGSQRPECITLRASAGLPQRTAMLSYSSHAVVPSDVTVADGEFVAQKWSTLP